MERYVQQLLSDLASAIENIQTSFAEQELNLGDWLTDEEEERTAPVRNLPQWSGIAAESLPPSSMLLDNQVHDLLKALCKLMNEYNCHFVLQTEVPERIQYETIRNNWNQGVKLKRWHMGFFQLCVPGTVHKTCTLGPYCQCTFYEQLFSRFIDEDLSPEEERARALEIEIKHIKRKYGGDWMKYYPYHLDKEYDDENGHPYNYGFNDGEGEDDDDDNWWRK
jgi:hypothetical protein